MFDTVLVIDWSSASSPSPRRESANAIWIGRASHDGVSSSYHRTRREAEAALIGMLSAERQAGRTVLGGFDFAFGYPEGFAERLTGQAGAPSVWHWLDAHLVDGEANCNDRFTLADAINRSFGGAGPFWGRPASLALADLPETKRVDYAALGLAERRRVENKVTRAQPVWKLYTAGSVGGQVLTGLPLIHRLSLLPEVGVWPFGACDAPIVLAEVYPSLIDAIVSRDGRPGAIKDDMQVRILALALWRLGQAGQLGTLLADVPDWPGRIDEGWILGAGHEAALAAALP